MGKFLAGGNNASARCSFCETAGDWFTVNDSEFDDILF